MENQDSITITTNELRSLLINAKYAVELAKDLAEEIGEDETASGSVGYRAGQIYSKLDDVYEKLEDALVDHLPYVDVEREEDKYNN
jgi:hypothetical protein